MASAPGALSYIRSDDVIVTSLETTLLRILTNDVISMLQRWAKFSTGLVRSSIRMICAKNDETMSKFVKVMPRIMWILCCGHGVYYARVFDVCKR